MKMLKVAAASLLFAGLTGCNEPQKSTLNTGVRSDELGTHSGVMPLAWSSACKPDSYAVVDKTDLAGSVKLNRVTVRAMKKPEAFATSQPVTLCKGQQLPHRDCRPKDSNDPRLVDFDGAIMEITAGSPLKMTLKSKKRDDEADMQVGGSAGNFSYLKGISNTTKNTYFVLFPDPDPTLPQLGYDLKKFYYIEVYYQAEDGSVLCDTHMPDQPALPDNDSDDGGSGQGGVGGGIEPGPHHR